MKNSCLKVNKSKTWHWQPEDRAFGNVLGVVQSEDWSNLVTLLWLLWYYSPNLTCPNSQGTFFCLSEMLQLSPLCWGCFTARVQSCVPDCDAYLLGSWRHSSIVQHASPAIQDSACVLELSTEQKYRLNHMLWSYRTSSTKFMRYSKQFWLFGLQNPHLRVISWTGPCYLRVPTY